MGLVIFRCDSSLAIGSGHVMRCRTLARALKRRGAEIVFLCRRQPGDLIALLEQEFRVLVLTTCPQISPEAEQVTSIKGRELYSSWLGCSEEQDAIESLAALAHGQLQSPSWVVVDHYALAALWEHRVQEDLRLAGSSTPNVLALDDLADRVHQVNVLVDASRPDSAAPGPYRDLVPETCTTLLGPAYALLEPIYMQLQPLLAARSKLDRVLVFFGGMDASNHAGVALQALSHPRLLHLSVDVAVGTATPHLADLESRVLQRPNTKLHVGLPSLAGLMARADLALGAAGTASWERVCLGLPCLVVPVADNQEQGARALQASGAARCLNLQAEADPVATLSMALLNVLDDPEALKGMSESCLQLGDGRGLHRVVAVMLGPAQGLRLRQALAADQWLYHWWANDPQVRLQSFHTDPIPLAQHRHWFAGRLSSPLTLLRVLVDGDGLPIGQIRFERAGESDDRVMISFSLDRLARGRGLAPRLLELGLRDMVRCWGDKCEPFGEVRSENVPSCRAFLRVGFQECPPPRQGVRCFLKSSRSAA